MAVRLARADARHYLVARLEEGDLLGERHDVGAKQRSELLDFAGEFAFRRPEVVLGGADDVAGVGE